jgi:3-oxosteroid 1-dehydrogenase
VHRRSSAEANDVGGELVVMGSGGAGLVAALHAATRGAKVTVLESAPVFGGETALSGGRMWAPLNRVGREAFGLEDSPDEVLRYLAALTHGLVAPQTHEAFVRNAPRFVDFLVAKTPCDVRPTAFGDYYRDTPGAKGPGRSIYVGLYDTTRLGECQKLLRQMPWPGTFDGVMDIEQRDSGWDEDRRLLELAKARRAKGIAAAGRALIGGLMEACLSSGVALVNNARVVSAIQEGGRIRAVEAQHDGKLERFSTDLGLVLASGGFEWDRTLWNSLVGVPLDGAYSPPYNIGDGLRIAARAGARLGNMGQVWWNPGMHIPGDAYDGKPRMRANTLLRRAGVITVNRQGRRFFNENMPYIDSGRPLTSFDAQAHAFTNYPAFCITDRETIERQPVLFRDHTTPLTDDWLFRAPTLRALSEKIGIDGDGLEEQVREWNANCEQGVDPDFGRGGEHDLPVATRTVVDSGWKVKNALLRPITDGPYYAVQLRAVCYGTNCGPVIDGAARVIGWDDAPIPGLYAAGNVSAGIFGHSYPGAGSTIGAGVVMGWTAAETATS